MRLAAHCPLEGATLTGDVTHIHKRDVHTLANSDSDSCSGTRLCLPAQTASPPLARSNPGTAPYTTALKKASSLRPCNSDASGSLVPALGDCLSPVDSQPSGVHVHDAIAPATLWPADVTTSQVTELPLPVSGAQRHTHGRCALCSCTSPHAPLDRSSHNQIAAAHTVSLRIPNRFVTLPRIHVANDSGNVHHHTSPRKRATSLLLSLMRCTRTQGRQVLTDAELTWSTVQGGVLARSTAVAPHRRQCHLTAHLPRSLTITPLHP